MHTFLLRRTHPPPEIAVLALCERGLCINQCKFLGRHPFDWLLGQIKPSTRTPKNALHYSRNDLCPKKELLLRQL